jgi:hypothetical protein
VRPLRVQRGEESPTIGPCDLAVQLAGLLEPVRRQRNRMYGMTWPIAPAG